MKLKRGADNVKLGIFTDPHCCSADRLCEVRRPVLSMGKLREAMDDFAKQGADAVICLGDLLNIWGTQDEMDACLGEVSALLRGYGLPVFCCPGNHDCEIYTKEEFAKRSGFVCAPACVDMGGVRLILLDADYFADGESYSPARSKWTDSCLPGAELERLKEALDTDLPCYIFLHQVLDPAAEHRHLVKNAEEIRAMLAAAGNVRGVWQGHYHPGVESVIDGIPYHTLPAVCVEEENPRVLAEL